MTGRERSTRGKLGAVFFAVVMVTSMVAIGGAAFAGTAAADEDLDNVKPTVNPDDGYSGLVDIHNYTVSAIDGSTGGANFDGNKLDEVAVAYDSSGIIAGPGSFQPEDVEVIVDDGSSETSLTVDNVQTVEDGDVSSVGNSQTFDFQSAGNAGDTTSLSGSDNDAIAIDVDESESAADIDAGDDITIRVRGVENAGDYDVRVGVADDTGSTTVVGSDTPFSFSSPGSVESL